MKSVMTFRRALLTHLVLLATAISIKAEDSVRSHQAPAGEPLSTNFYMTVGRKEVPVYVAKVASADPAQRWKAMDDKVNSAQYFSQASFTHFDLLGVAEVIVTCSTLVHEAKILPASSGIVPKIDGNRIAFTLNKPRSLVLEVNGDWVGSLQIFANPPETNIPRPDDPDVIYYGPGIHEVDGVRVDSGKTVYIADGAIVRGTTKAVGRSRSAFELYGSNITLRGRGILDGSACPTHARHLISVVGTNVTLEGVILRDSSHWTVPIRRSENVTVRNLKLIGYRANSDGIDICNSRNVEVSDCYIRTLDDLIVVKSDKGQGIVRNIRAHDCVLWNEVAHALSIGAELRESVEDVRFSNCDIIHDKGREWTLRVYHCDSARISNVLFENLRVEETRKFMSLWIGSAVWSRDNERGHIEGVTFRDISAAGDQPRVEFRGFDASHGVSDVKCERVAINGQPLKAGDIKCNEFVSGVSVAP